MDGYNSADEFIAAKRSVSLHGVIFEKGVVIDKTLLTPAELQNLFFWGLIAPAPRPDTEAGTEAGESE